MDNEKYEEYVRRYSECYKLDKKEAEGRAIVKEVKNYYESSKDSRV